ncbi:Aldo/keto reductase [Decorospora gaudefroyi]|uniref:Aldo/keto reductase n=1 Tax=Decorospora gaudefroyi TaxID=184978 RepID=A0A6A5K0M2_9PLEO|nr:Aldo/keto reductase [Decorospora gaudefroyi]
MAVVPRSKANTAHVNMMTDTIIANLPADALRSVIRVILTTEPSVTSIFEEQTRIYLRKTANQPIGQLFQSTAEGVASTSNFTWAQQRLRSTIGCGLALDSFPILNKIVEESFSLNDGHTVHRSPEFDRCLASVDGDIVQALTAIQKRLLSDGGSRDLNEDEKLVMNSLFDSLLRCRQTWLPLAQDFPFERSTAVLVTMLGRESGIPIMADQNGSRQGQMTGRKTSTSLETFTIKDMELPKLFAGLWQLSSPSWGTASQTQMFKQFVEYIAGGFTAFDMADHYGDAEVIFGRLRSSLSDPEAIFGATKYCVFHKITVTPAVIRANVTERCQRMSADKVDLLQFHWQDYNDHQYIEALRLLQQDERVRSLGLCNFDTARLQEVVDNDINVVTNQVQFSLIDARPRFMMGDVCAQRNVKLLTYGTLCGGFLAEKWLGKPEPQLFGPDSTPSQRKYFEMIQTWGDWDLFQVLLQTLKAIATKHNVSISNVATRWVLDFPFVGAVIIGARMGVSEHTEENLKTYGWKLDEEDQKSIEEVLEKSRREEVFKVMGDCGSEYR